MALYGTVPYGSTTYGYDAAPGSAIALWRQVYGGWAAWLPENIIHARTACWEAATTNTAFTWNTPIAGLTTGSSWHIQRNGLALPEDTLTLQIADPTGRYLEAGDRAADLAPNALVLVRSTVTTAAGALVYATIPHRVTKGLTRTRDYWGRDVLQTEAQDWLRALLEQQVNPMSPGAQQIATPQDSPLVLGAKLAGLQNLTDDPSYLDLLRGLYSVLGGGTAWNGRGSPPSGCAVVEGTSRGETVLFLGTTSEGELIADPDAIKDDWTRGSNPDMTWLGLIESLHERYGWAAFYQANGRPILQDATARLDTGYVVSCDPAVGGAFPVPWEKHTQTLSRPQYTQVQVWGPPDPPDAYVPLVLRDFATSTHPGMLHEAPFGRVQYLRDRGSAGRALRDALGRADQIVLTVDSCCPPPADGGAVRIVVPEDQIQGWYLLQSAQVPCNPAQAASWTLSWEARA